MQIDKRLLLLLSYSRSAVRLLYSMQARYLASILTEHERLYVVTQTSYIRSSNLLLMLTCSYDEDDALLSRA